jgi:hypothetical protein
MIIERENYNHLISNSSDFVTASWAALTA